MSLSMRWILLPLWCALLLALGAGVSIAQQSETPANRLTVATRVLPPFIVKVGDSYEGFSAELWKGIAAEAGLQFDWKEVNNITEILAEVESGRSQAAIAAISITSERESRFDFSQPIFESGLQILVRDEGESSFSVGNLMQILSSGALPVMLGLLAALVLIPAHVVWFAERKHGNPLFSMNYIPGIFHAMWWAVGAAAGQQPDIPRSGLGRFFSAISILISVIFMAFFTATLTASITVGQLQGSIQGPGDLAGKKVGTTRGSTAAQYLSDRSIAPVEFDKIDAAIADLESKQLDAVVFDSPVLMYHVANEGRGKVRTVGSVFRRENYGILLPAASPLRKAVNAALLKMRENGSYDRIYGRWFEQARE